LCALTVAVLALSLDPPRVESWPSLVLDRTLH
jgi:hypothetical protein